MCGGGEEAALSPGRHGLLFEEDPGLRDVLHRLEAGEAELRALLEESRELDRQIDRKQRSASTPGVAPRHAPVAVSMASGTLVA